MAGHSLLQVDVVIIGAGASGLQCASSLLEAVAKTDEELSLVILEARDRMGGRVLTVSETKHELSKNRPASFVRDLGAAWVHGIGAYDSSNGRNPMVELLERITPKDEDVIDYHLHPIFDGNCWTRPDSILHKADQVALFCDGKIISNSSELVSEAVRMHYKRRQELAEYADSLYDAGEGMLTVETSVAEARSKLSGELISSNTVELIDYLVPFYAFLGTNWDGVSETELQLAGVELPEVAMETDENYNPDGDFEGPHCKVKLGMETVLKPLMKKMGQHVLFGEKVSSISKQVDGSVKVETSSGLIVDAECCISSIPLGCLQKDASSLFRPPLEAETMEAIQSPSTGVYKKVFLTFDRIFWPLKEPLMGLIRRTKSVSDELGKHLLVYNFWAKKSVPCLEAILCGDAGKWAVHRSDSEIQDAVIRFMEEAMNVRGIASSCIDCHITRWEEDRHTLGSYTSFRVGTLERHIEKLATPHWDGSLIFAGEFTDSEHMGSVHGALASGRRAAEQALEGLVLRRKL